MNMRKLVKDLAIGKIIKPADEGDPVFVTGLVGGLAERH
jgi:hypothetical protein